MAVTVVNEQDACRLRPLSVKRRLQKVLRALGRGDCSVAVLLTDDPGIREINKKFRGLDAATNVLSFPGGPPFPGEKAPHLGDVALSVETVLREAAEGDRPAGEVLYFYLVHGLTHLLGYDHCKGPLDEKAQELEQERLLALIPLDL